MYKEFKDYQRKQESEKKEEKRVKQKEEEAKKVTAINFVSRNLVEDMRKMAGTLDEGSELTVSGSEWIESYLVENAL